MALLVSAIPWTNSDATQSPVEQAAATVARSNAPVALPLVTSSRALPPKPNVVLITADDMRADDLRAMPFVTGVLAKRGVRFTDAISPYSLCCPARAEILKGRYSHNTGMRGNKWPNGGYWALRSPGRTLPVWLQRAGYRTGFIGKYLNEYGKEVPDDPRLAGRSRNEIPPGWHQWYASIERVYSYVGVKLRVDTPRTDPHFVNSHTYQSRLFADIGANVIGSFHGSGDPFFLWYSSATPHGRPAAGGARPPVPHPDDADLYDEAPLPQNPVYQEALNEDTRDKAGPMYDLPPVAGGRSELRRFHRNRLASLSSLDDSVKAVWEKLRTTGELDDTVIIFTSDNGFALGAHRRKGKDMPYDAMLRVPMIVSAPALKQRYRPGAGPDQIVRSDYTVTTLDIATTIKALSGATTPWPMEGVNLMRPGENPDQGGDRGVLIESGAIAGRGKTPINKFIGVRTDRWTWFGWDARPAADTPQYNAAGRYDDVGWFELYDRRATPSQVTNIVDEAPASVSARLREMVAAKYDCRGRGCVWDASR